MSVVMLERSRVLLACEQNWAGWAGQGASSRVASFHASVDVGGSALQRDSADLL